ncbi:MAG: DNA replication and repair protein RecF [Syntrophomonadaceae bacterium]|nr:DNA replication and repair protein RecF [Syntrophomonadaceae bacterium]
MIIEELRIRDFRNLKKIDYIPASGLNVFLGDNAQGKTNLLESIFVLAAGNSFRSATDANLVNHEASGYMVKTNYLVADRKMEAKLEYRLNQAKIFTINKKKCTQSHMDRLRVVLFTPDDLFLVKGPPGKRRAFLDFMLKQLSSEYLYNLDNYYSILKKRNLLLKKEQTTVKSFKIINDLFVENAVRVIIQRINIVNLLDETTRSIYNEINQGGNQLKTRYALSFEVDNDKINIDVLSKAMQKKIEEVFNEEIKRRKTMVGPHLDDINIYQDRQMARVFASQGQQRNIAISLKLAEMDAFRKVKGFYPVLLLDEVLSELDEGKRKMLMNLLSHAGFQTFLTSVNMDNMDKSDEARFIVKEGRLLRKEL